MCQPKGFGDGTNKFCWLIKTIYSLKQSGWEWNHELDNRLKTKGFQSLWSDACVYIWGISDDIEIITVWVDDLLLITISDEHIAKLKQVLNTILELTDLGELAKIEITQTPDSC